MSHEGDEQSGGNKAIRILMSARAVAAEIDRLRQSLTQAGRRLPEGHPLVAELDDAVARLCNLISLAVAEIDLGSAGESLRVRFDALLGDVRARWLAHNIDQMTTRLAVIGDQAAEALSTRTYRLGLADRLERACAEIVDVLRAMGAENRPGLESERLAAILADIRTLARLESEMFHIVDFGAHRD